MQKKFCSVKIKVLTVQGSTFRGPKGDMLPLHLSVYRRQNLFNNLRDATLFCFIGWVHLVQPPLYHHESVSTGTHVILLCMYLCITLLIINNIAMYAIECVMHLCICPTPICVLCVKCLHQYSCPVCQHLCMQSWDEFRK